MSDKELSDYIKTIDPKFNSNLEKGTIEMTNEYYNLLEEYIARLNNKKDLYKNVLDKIKEYIDNYDVFKEFTFPLMKRDEEQQVLTSIKYEFDTSIKKNLYKILEEIE